jgi:hypothetical protein
MSQINYTLQQQKAWSLLFRLITDAEQHGMVKGLSQNIMSTAELLETYERQRILQLIENTKIEIDGSLK